MVWPASSSTSSNWWLPFFQRLDMLLNITIFASNSFLIDSQCPAFEPFRCPEERKCISIQVQCHHYPHPPHNQHNCDSKHCHQYYHPCCSLPHQYHFSIFVMALKIVRMVTTRTRSCALQVETIFNLNTLDFPGFDWFFTSASLLSS